MRARGDDDFIGAVLKYIFGSHLTDAKMHINVPLLIQLSLPIGNDAPPLTETGKLNHTLPVSTELTFSLSKVDGIASQSEDARTLHSRRATAHNKHRTRRL